jgi:hypothetical protein
MAAPAASKAVKAPAPVAHEQRRVPPTPPAEPSATQTRRPVAGLLVPVNGMPPWLEDVLLAAGLLAGTAFAAEPAVALTRRRRKSGDRSAK